MSWNRKKQEALKHSKHSSHKNRRNQTFNRESYKSYDEDAIEIVSDYSYNRIP